MILKNNTLARPFVKWVGGKTQLLSEIEALLPHFLYSSKNITYVESFVGGGAVLFWILQQFPNIHHAIINDINLDLINTYKTIKENPKELISILKQIEKEYIYKSEIDRKEYFLLQRELFNSKQEDIILNSALFIFLNKTCFNGLYRVNNAGKFNVPYGKYKKPTICDEENILKCHELLKKVEILQGDFSQTLNYAGKNTFYYLDPPYKPINKTSSFTAYSKENFTDKDQIRLSEFCDNISKKGGYFILSNSDVNTIDKKDSFFDDLYSMYHIHRVMASRMINSNASKRGKIYEIMINNSETKIRLDYGK
ncbi:MAG: DNA adenine methylase [Bacteroidales bacterium]|nr:DNA adenine methylase [Bacteroidales bacterium]